RRLPQVLSGQDQPRRRPRGSPGRLLGRRLLGGAAGRARPESPRRGRDPAGAGRGRRHQEREVTAVEKLFGTDGVRGIPGKAPLLPETIMRIGRLAAELMRNQPGVHLNGNAPIILIARDTRGSGSAITSDLAKGFAVAGCRTLDLGVAPTAAVSYLVPALGALCGAVVSASHNPAEFNGIKFFTAQGFKMDPSTEDLIEKELAASELTLAQGAAALKRFPVSDASAH